MNNVIEMRLTPERTPGYTFDSFSSWLDTLAASSIMCCEENKSYHTGSPSAYHFHILIITHLQKQSIRTSFKKTFPQAKGNQSFKFKMVKDQTAYELYCAKFNQPKYLRGYTKEDIEQLSEKFAETFIKNKKKRKEKNKNKIGRIKDYISGKTDLFGLSSGMLMYHIIEYHIDREVLFNEYEAKKIFNFIKYERMSQKERIQYAQNLVQEF